MSSYNLPVTPAPEEKATAAAASTPEGRPAPGGARPTGLFTFLFIAGYFATMMAVITPVTIGISLKLLEIAPASVENAQALVLGVGAFFAAVASPIAGLLSDRSTSRFGRRRTYILAGVLLGSIGLVVMAFAVNVPVFVAGWAITQFGMNAVFSSLYGMMADQIPASRRGRISGYIGLGQALGAFGGVGLAAVFPTMLAITFLVPAAIALVVIAVLALFAPDIRQSKADVPPFRAIDLVGTFWVNPRRYPDYGWAWAGRFLIQFANAAATSFTALFLLSRYGFGVPEVAEMTFYITLLGVGVTAIASPIAGWLSDRFRRRKVFVFTSSLLFTLGVLIICVAPSFEIFVLGSTVLNLGFAFYGAVDLALVTDVLPENGARAGKDLGVFNLANTLPQSLAPAVAPLLLGLGAAQSGSNYVALFIAAAVASVLGAVSVYFIKGVR